jgi:hypothetical protein
VTNRKCQTGENRCTINGKEAAWQSLGDCGPVVGSTACGVHPTETAPSVRERSVYPVTPTDTRPIPLTCMKLED